MTDKIYTLLIIVTLFLSFTKVLAQQTVYYTSWTSVTNGKPGTAIGIINLPNVNSVVINYTGEVAGSNSYQPNYWTLPSPRAWTNNAVVANSPTNGQMIQLNSYHQTNTITFSKPVSNPIMLLFSVGAPPAPITYIFQQPFILLSSGPDNYTTTGSLAQNGESLTGAEGSGTIQFIGTISSITWSNMQGAEYYQGFTIGLTNQPVPFSPIITLTNMGVNISWLSDSNLYYQLQFANTLNSNAWSNLGSPVIGTGSTNYYFDEFGSYSQRFYRILTVP